MLDSERREGRKIALPKDLKIDFIGFDMLRFPLLFPSVYKEIFSSRQEWRRNKFRLPIYLTLLLIWLSHILSSLYMKFVIELVPMEVTVKNIHETRRRIQVCRFLNYAMILVYLVYWCHFLKSVFRNKSAETPKSWKVSMDNRDTR